MEETDKDIKRLVIDMPVQLHKEIKMRATNKNISIKKWVLQAVLEAIAREKEYE